MSAEPRLYLLQCGTLQTKLHEIKNKTGLGEDYEIPVPWFVVTHPKGTVVIDGGNPPQVADDPVAYWGEERAHGFWPTMTTEDRVVPQLQKLGIDLASVRWVIQSHLHMDHTGAVAAIENFPNAKVLVARREYEYARNPDWFALGSYVAKDFADPRIKWVMIEDDEDGYDVFGDGTLRCWHTPGHSPGHQSFTVTLPDTGTWLICVDAAYTTDHWERRVLQGFTTSNIEAARSVDKLHRLAERESAQLILGHDPDGWPTLDHAPKYYA